jgi:hypothetical protein
METTGRNKCGRTRVTALRFARTARKSSDYWKLRPKIVDFCPELQKIAASQGIKRDCNSFLSK